MARDCSIRTRELAAESPFSGVRCDCCTGSLARSAYVGREIGCFLMISMTTDSFLQVKAEMFLLVGSSPCNRMEVIKCEELPRSVVFAELNHSCSFPRIPNRFM